MKNTTWMIFSIKEQQVMQITYNGCTGQDLIDSHKTMIANKYKTSENDVKISFKEELDDKDKKDRAISFELVREAKMMLKLKENQN